MRTTGVLSQKDRFRDAWITVPCAPVITINARLGNHFRLRLTENAVLEPPNEPHAGQEIILRIEQDTTGSRTLTPNSTKITTRGTLVLSSAASAVTLWRLTYDEDSKMWDIWGLVGVGTAYAANKAAAQADSTAVLLALLVGDFNSLLAKLRTAGLMEV